MLYKYCLNGVIVSSGATVSTSKIHQSAYVAFNGDKYDPADKKLRFYKYFYEPLAQDYPPFDGGGPQIAIEGGPLVDILENWDDANKKWRVVWDATSEKRPNKPLQRTSR